MQVAHSIEHPQVKASKGFVRADLIDSGFIVCTSTVFVVFLKIYAHTYCSLDLSTGVFGMAIILPTLLIFA